MEIPQNISGLLRFVSYHFVAQIDKKYGLFWKWMFPKIGGFLPPQKSSI